MPILTARIGTSADIFPDILALYVKPESAIADLTYGKGVFWRKVDIRKYNLYASDLCPKLDFVHKIDARKTPYPDASMDVVIFDPDFGNGSTKPRKIMDDQYEMGANRTPDGIRALYWYVMMEMKRILKRGGISIIKCQDMVNSGKQQRIAMEIQQVATSALGWTDLDRFTLVRQGIPMMRHAHQVHARKNESCFWVFQK